VTVDSRFQEYRTGPYWSGHRCLDLRMPWFVPEAIEFLLLRKKFLAEATVLELGSGGSTLFWKDVAKSIHSYETSRAWFETVKEMLSLEKDHLLALLDPQQMVVHTTFGNIAINYAASATRFDVLVVDGDPKVYSRGEAAHYLLPLMKPRSIVITDNYYERENVIEDFTRPSEWKHLDFNDVRWHGCGTRISMRGF
jgi:hypothetical protein